MLAAQLTQLFREIFDSNYTRNKDLGSNLRPGAEPASHGWPDGHRMSVRCFKRRGIAPWSAGDKASSDEYYQKEGSAGAKQGIAGLFARQRLCARELIHAVIKILFRIINKWDSITVTI
jgi:hypothetical protein